MSRAPERYLFLLVLIVIANCAEGFAQSVAQPKVANKNQGVCQQGMAGSIVTEPADRSSKNGSSKLTLTARSSVNSDDAQAERIRYCYIDEHGNQAPTIRVQPGDLLTLYLKNKISLPAPNTHSHFGSKSTKKAHLNGSCTGAVLTRSATNLHFHGLAVPPVCHQDETLSTLIEPGDPPFEYHIRIPADQPPGLYWYHPHVHGFTEEQLLGGASGALIVEGIGQAAPRVAGLPERVLVIRDEKMAPSLDSEKADPDRPTKQLSINSIPVRYPKYEPGVIKMKPLEREFWRLVNASADTYLELSLLYDGKRQNVDLVALDGVPLHFGEPGARDYAQQQSDIFLPPGSRAEFIVTGPSEGVSGVLRTTRVYRGAGDDNGPLLRKDSNQPALRLGQDDVDPPRPLANLIASSDASPPQYIERASGRTLQSIAAPLSSVRPVRKRKLYFSEKVVRPGDPTSPTLFFITKEGDSPAIFDPHSAEPMITVHQGEVEDWVIENRSQESHVFHIHQLHFLVVESRGTGWQEATLRDTVNLPAWDGFRQYPSATLRMDFRDPQIVGTFPFHCHIAQHSDGGMMGLVRVEPAPK